MCLIAKHSGAMTSYEMFSDINSLVEIIRKAEHYYGIKERYPNGAPENVKERDLVAKANALRLYAESLRRKPENSIVVSKVYAVRAEARVYAAALERVAKDFESL